MSIHEIKISLTQLIEGVNDKTVLEAYHDILKSLLKVQNSQIVGYTADNEPVSKATLEKKVLEARENVKSGNFTSHEDLKKEMDNW